MRIAVVLLLVLTTPVWAINSRYKTWDGERCLIIKTNEMVLCTKEMLAEIDRLGPQRGK